MDAASQSLKKAETLLFANPNRAVIPAGNIELAASKIETIQLVLLGDHERLGEGMARMLEKTPDRKARFWFSAPPQTTS